MTVTPTLSPECQSAQMSKITNDSLTWSGTECFVAYSYGDSGCQRVNGPGLWSVAVLQMTYSCVYS